jgi:hypothetical protein
MTPCCLPGGAFIRKSYLNWSGVSIGEKALKTKTISKQAGHILEIRALASLDVV